MNSKSVCITGGNFINKGAEAMLLTIADALRENCRDTRIYVACERAYHDTAARHGLIPRSCEREVNLYKRSIEKIRSIYMDFKCNYFVDVGGYQFSDNHGCSVIEKKASVNRRRRRMGSRLYYMPQAWGPFQNTRTCNAVRKIIETADLIFVRDAYSWAHVMRHFGDEKSKFKIAPDIAWTFNGDAACAGEAVLRAHGLERRAGSRVVGIVPNMRVYERSDGHGLNNLYVQHLATIVRYLREKHDSDVVLVGHEYNAIGLQMHDDRILCKNVYEACGRPKRVAVVDAELTARRMKSLIGHFDACIGSRYHSLIAALSQGIPVMAIGWSHKYDALLSSVGLDSNMLPISMATEDLCKEIDRFLGGIERMRATVCTYLPAIKKEAAEAVKIVTEKIEADAEIA